MIKNEFTKYHGKKLTNQWQTIKNQEDEIKRRNGFCEQKEANLQNLKFKYNQIVALRKRNKLMIEEGSVSTDKKLLNREEGQKIPFPFILLPKIHHVLLS